VSAGVGRAYLPGTGAKGPAVHRVAPLDGVVATAAAGDDRPTVLVLLSARGGEIGAWLLRTLGDDFRFVVFLGGSEGGPSLRRGLAELAARVYPVDRFLEPVVWPSLVTDVVRAQDVRAILRIGASFELPLFEESRPVIVDLPIDRSEILAGADSTLALGRGIAEAAQDRGEMTRELVPGPAPGGEIPQTDRSADVRSAYGVPGDAYLVLTVCDLEPAHRPEDVAAIARRLRNREDIHLLLIGQGSLAGSISDLAGYFELDRFTFAPPGHSVTEIVAACDCVLGTAEVDPWPVAIGAALALGRSVVATEIDGVRELVAAANGDRCTLLPPGDVNGLAAAVVEALESQRKPRATKKAWNAARARSAKAAHVVGAALTGGSSGEQEKP
jgi:glycosyltransferase involved in cell wall biosynthesis